MGEFEYPLARAARPRWRRVPRRGAILTVAAAAVLTMLGAHDGGDQLRRAGGRVSVPPAEAAPERPSARAQEDRPILVRTELIRISQAADIGMTPLRGAEATARPAEPAPEPPKRAEPAPEAPKRAEAAPEVPKRTDIQAIVTAQRAPPSPLFENQSLAGTEAAGSAMPDMALRASTDAALPLDGLAPDIAAIPSRPSEPAGRREPGPRLGGTWAGSAAGCGRRSTTFVPLVIDGRGARAGSASCAFGRTRQAGNRWTIAATCRSGAETWAANVKLTIEGRRLTWSSERGTETYTRCR